MLIAEVLGDAVSPMDLLRRRCAVLPFGAQRGLLWLAAAATYFGSMELSDSLTPAGSAVPVLWLAYGVGYGIVTVGGRSFLAPLALAALVEALVEDGYGPWQSLVFAVGTTLAVVLAVEIVWRLGRRDGERVSDTLVRLSAAVPGAALAALALELERGGSFHYWWHAAAAQFAGFVIAGPLLRTWLRSDLHGVASRVEAGILALAAAGFAELAASGAIGGAEPLVYLMVPPLLWAALRTGRRGVSITALVMALVAAENLSHGHGSFGAGRFDAALSLDVFLTVLTATALLLAGLETERREGEETLRRSGARYRALIENATDVITVLGADGTVLYESPSVTPIFGWKLEELVGSDVFAHIHLDDLEHVREAFDRVVAGEDAVVELRFRRKDGSWAEVVSHARNLVDDPAVGGIVVNSRDVTESRRADRERAEAEARYRGLVEQLPLVTYVNGPTPDEPPVFVSSQIETLLGYPVEAWYEDPRFSWRIIHPDDLALLDQLLVEDGPVHAEYRMLTADGRVVWVLDHMVTMRDPAGERVAVQGFLLDITERKQLEEQLRMAQRLEALGLLAGGVAHDFNNLLTAIGGNLDLAEAFADDRPRLLEHLREVRRAAERAAGMTRQLLAFGRRQVLEQGVVDLNAVVQDARPLLERLLGEEGELELALDPQLARVRADASQLGQVLVNLVVNARDAMPEGGCVTIRTANEGDSVLVSVADCGAGIAPEASERLFEPFFTTKPVGEGTGLGLAVVHGIVRQSHGRVEVRSEPGRGAEFRVLLPRTDKASPERPRRNGHLPRGTETVLLVEDEEMVRRLTEDMLERQGYHVLTAASPEDALAVEEPYSLLLTDVVMPGMSGPELAELLEARRPDVAVLYTSGYSGGALADNPSLAERLLEKPFTLEQLAVRVREALDAR